MYKKYGQAIFILGGSHGIDLHNALASNASNPFIVSVSKGFCRAYEMTEEQKRLYQCQYDDFKRFANEYSKNISYVIYTQTPDRLFGSKSIEDSNREDLSTERLKSVARYLSEIKENYSLNVIMIGMLPPLKKSPINWDYRLPLDQQLDDVVSHNAINLTKVVDEVFSFELKKHSIPYISKYEAFSLDLPVDLIIDNELTYSDKRHLSYKGEEIFGRRLINNMNSRGYKIFNTPD